MGVNSLPKTVTRRRRDCDLNPGPSPPESSTLTTRPPSHPGADVGGQMSGHAWTCPATLGPVPRRLVKYAVRWSRRGPAASFRRLWPRAAFQSAYSNSQSPAPAFYAQLRLTTCNT